MRRILALILCLLCVPAVAQQRIPSGVTDQYVYFRMFDATDHITPETGLSSFTVYRSRDGGAATAWTTPTVNETSSANMPGLYELLVDEDTTLSAGNDSEVLAIHVTHAGADPVVIPVELYRNNPTYLGGSKIEHVTWYVDDSAGGAADGTSLPDAFTTITAAVSAASPGDLIWIADGTYTEEINLTKENLTFEGESTDGVTWTASTTLTNGTLTIADNTTIRRLTMDNTNDGACIDGSGAKRLLVEDCVLNGEGDAIFYVNVDATPAYITLKRTTCTADFDGLALAGVTLHLDHCYVTIDSTNNPGGATFAISLATSNAPASAYILNSTIEATRGASHAGETTDAIDTIKLSGDATVLIVGGAVLCSATDATDNGPVNAIRTIGSSSTRPLVFIEGATVESSTAGGGTVYTLNASDQYGVIVHDGSVDNSQINAVGTVVDKTKVLSTDIEAIPTTTELNDRTLVSSAYFDPTTDAIPYNSAWDTEIQSEVQDAINASLPGGSGLIAEAGATATNLDEVSGGSGGTQVAATNVSKERTWFPPGSGSNPHQANNIVTVTAGFDGTLCFDLSKALNPDTDILTVSSVTATGGNTLTFDTLRKSTDAKKALFNTVETLVSGDTHTVTCTVTTTDSQTIPFTGTLKVP